MINNEVRTAAVVENDGVHEEIIIFQRPATELETSGKALVPKVVSPQRLAAFYLP